MQITTEGRKYLGGTSGTEIFQQAFVANKVDEWMKELKALVHVAQSQPHVTYTAFTHRIIAKWSYVIRVTNLEESSSSLLQPLEYAIGSQFFPCPTGQIHLMPHFGSCLHYHQA